MRVRRLIKAALIPSLACLLVVTGLAFYEYRDGRQEIKNRFDDIAAKLAARLSGSLREPIWNFDEVAIVNTIKSELNTSLYDCTICVSEKSHSFYGFIKHPDGKIQQINTAPDDKELSAGAITVRDDQAIASIRVYMGKQLQESAEKDLLYDITMRMSLIGSGATIIIITLIYCFMLLLDRLAERKQALQVSELRYQSLVENAPLPILVHHEGIIRYLNPAARIMFGVSPDENMIGRSIGEFVVPESAATYAEKLKQAKDQPEQIRHGELEVLNAKGNKINIVTTAMQIQFEGQTCQQVLIMDITERIRNEKERRAIEAKMQHTQKLESLGVLAGGIAHDFNNLLTAILGNAELAMSEIPDAMPQRLYLSEITKISTRAAGLCRQMLAYSGKGSFSVELIDLCKAASEMVDMLKVGISKKITLDCRCENGVAMTMADSNQIRQIIMNLITNASDAIGDKEGVIRISTGVMKCDEQYLNDSYINEDLRSGLYSYIEVSDTGCGMDQVTLGKIFEPFFTTKFTGRGLGLSAVLGIVRGHRGALKVYSEVGMGTTFKVFFPSSNAPATQQIESEPDEKWRGRGVILIVDDEASIRTTAKRMAKVIGFEAYEAADGKEGVEIYMQKRSEITCVMLDLTMPKMDGAEAWAAIRNIDPNIPIIISSGYSEHDIAKRFAGKGKVIFIDKPYRMATFKTKIRQALEDQPNGSDASDNPNPPR